MANQDRADLELINDLGAGAWHARALYVAAKLGVADYIEDHNATPIADLAKATGAHEDALYRVLRVLSGLGVFHEDDGRAFSHTPASKLLRSDHEMSQRYGTIFRGEELYAAYKEILSSVQTGQPVFERVFGASLFEYFQSDAASHSSFQAHMRGLTQFTNWAVFDAYDFSRFEKAVDVGGGNGTFLSAILERYPALTAILFDRDSTIGLAKSRSDLPSTRIEFVAGNFFDSVPEGGDLYILKQVIHDWYDDDAIKILRNCRQAMGESETLLVIDSVIGPPNEKSFGPTMDLSMLVAVGGKERREEEFRAILEKSGFRLNRVIPTQSYISIVEAEPVSNV